MGSMSQRFRLLYWKVRPANYKQVSEHLDRAGIDYYVQKSTSVQGLRDELINSDYDLILLDKLISEELLRMN